MSSWPSVCFLSLPAHEEAVLLQERTAVTRRAANRQPGEESNKKLSLRIKPPSSFVNMCQRAFSIVIPHLLLHVGGTIK
jgi:hypothetical protein